MKKEQKPKKQPTGDYQVGYARPPVSGKFTSTRQPINRRSKAVVPPPPVMTEHDRRILKEASRKVAIRNGDKVEFPEQYDAVMRALAVGGIKGSRIHADSFLDRMDLAIKRQEERRERNANAYYQYQAVWQRYKEQMRQQGLKPRPWVPNVNDVYLTDDGEVEILGPADHRERELYRELRRAGKSVRQRMLQCREIAREDEDNVQNWHELLEWTRQLERCNEFLKGDYKIPLR